LSSTAGALLPALLRDAVVSFDAIVHQSDISIIHKVAAFRERQAALLAAANTAGTTGTATAPANNASSSSSSSTLISLLTGARTGLPNSIGTGGVPAPTRTHTVRCYLTKQAKAGKGAQASPDEEDSAGGEDDEPGSSDTVSAVTTGSGDESAGHQDGHSHAASGNSARTEHSLGQQPGKHFIANSMLWLKHTVRFTESRRQHSVAETARIRMPVELFTPCRQSQTA
jgi:hypothetical protein